MATGETIAWDYRQLGAAFLVGLTLQGRVLPCLCPIGRAKMGVAFVFDAMVLGRILVAYYKKEQGRGWIFYSVLLYSSAFWIEGVTYAVFGET